MSNVYQLASRKNKVEEDKRIDEASLWLYKLDEGLTEKDKTELEQWLAADTENEQVFMEMVEMWDDMDVLSRLTDLFPQPVKHNSKSKWFPQALAASIVIAVIALFGGINDFIKPVDKPVIAVSHQKDLYQTAIGEHSTASLPDGSRIILNTNTLVKVSYTDRHRFLVLERGEVHVDVAHDKLRPLSVIAGDKIVQAVGTAFNIEMHHDNSIELVVTEGKVLVSSRDGTTEDIVSAQAVTLSDASLAVSEGHQLILGVPDEKVEAVEDADIQAKLSWREGTLVFQGESLAEAIREISRYTQVKFVFKDRSLKKMKVIGLFKAGDVNGLVTTLKDNFNISVSHQSSEGKILLDKSNSIE